MSMNFKRLLPIPKDIREEMPLSDEMRAKKVAFDEEVARVFCGEDPRKVLIIGPCSADREDSVLDYMTRLAAIAEEVREKILIIPRVYTNKPRTKGTGYKGLLHNPDPEAPDDLLEGVKAIRRMHLRVIEETGMFTADEMLYPTNFQYLIDLLSYVAVGARSSENQMHRLVSSGIDLPVGIKNPMSGSIPVLLNSIYAAQSGGQVFKYQNYQVRTSGNELAHAVLRGAVDGYGNDIPNFHYETVMKVIEGYSKTGLKNPAIVIDANHSNSGKQWNQQPRIVQEVLHSRSFLPEIKSLVKGIMIESYIEDGNQSIGNGVYGQSITDPCLGWDKSAALLYRMADTV